MVFLTCKVLPFTLISISSICVRQLFVSVGTVTAICYRTHRCQEKEPVLLKGIPRFVWLMGM